MKFPAELPQLRMVTFVELTVMTQVNRGMSSASLDPFNHRAAVSITSRDTIRDASLKLNLDLEQLSALNMVGYPGFRNEVAGLRS